MRARVSIMILGLILFFSTSVFSQNKKDISRFLSAIAEARMMDIEEGKIARDKGTTDAIREYGKEMVREQTLLLEKLKELAATKQIVLPENIGPKNTKALKKMQQQKGRKLDKKFMRRMTIYHKRDIRKLEDAAEWDDKEIRLFARQYLPLLQKHLDEIQDIRYDYK